MAGTDPAAQGGCGVDGPLLLKSSKEKRKMGRQAGGKQKSRAEETVTFRAGLDRLCYKRKDSPLSLTVRIIYLLSWCLTLFSIFLQNCRLDLYFILCATVEFSVGLKYFSFFSVLIFSA